MCVCVCVCVCMLHTCERVDREFVSVCFSSSVTRSVRKCAGC